MNAYLWQTRDDIVHFMRAATPEAVRERIAVIHGPETAQRAVIKRVGPGKGEPAAA